MAVITSLMVAIGFLSGLYLESLLGYAETYRYCRNKVSDAAGIYTKSEDDSEALEEWYGEEYLTRCRVAGMILKRMDPEDVTPVYLQRLSDSLGTETVYVFDPEGEARVTNSPYDSDAIGEDDPFYALLKGRMEMTMGPEVDAISGKVLQKAGIAVLGEDNRCTGMVMIVGSAYEIYEITDSMDVSAAFRRIGLIDGTSMLALYEMDAMGENIRRKAPEEA